MATSIANIESWISSIVYLYSNSIVQMHSAPNSGHYLFSGTAMGSHTSNVAGQTMERAVSNVTGRTMVGQSSNASGGGLGGQSINIPSALQNVAPHQGTNLECSQNTIDFLCIYVTFVLGVGCLSDRSSSYENYVLQMKAVPCSMLHFNHLHLMTNK